VEDNRERERVMRERGETINRDQFPALPADVVDVLTDCALAGARLELAPAVARMRSFPHLEATMAGGEGRPL
jgi:hypothetical protein